MNKNVIPKTLEEGKKEDKTAIRKKLSELQKKDFSDLLQTTKPFEAEWKILEEQTNTELDEKTIKERFKTGSEDKHQERNRYSDVLPNESTRVIIKAGTHDYINANWIKDLDPNIKYIAAQGPLDNTVEDFYLMCWDERVKLIITLTNEVEKGHLKCQRYWPERINEKITQGAFAMTLKENNSNLDSNLEKGIICRKIEFSKTNEPNRIIFQVQYVVWPDYGVPTNVDEFLKLVYFVDNKIKELGSDLGPVVVHCSAGLGSSGVFLAVHSEYRRYKSEKARKKDPEVCLFDLASKIRNSRHGMIQTYEQYEFTWKALAKLGEKKD